MIRRNNLNGKKRASLAPRNPRTGPFITSADCAIRAHFGSETNSSNTRKKDGLYFSSHNGCTFWTLRPCLSSIPSFLRFMHGRLLESQMALDFFTFLWLSTAIVWIAWRHSTWDGRQLNIGTTTRVGRIHHCPHASKQQQSPTPMPASSTTSSQVVPHQRAIWANAA